MTGVGIELSQTKVWTAKNLVWKSFFILDLSSTIFWDGHLPGFGWFAVDNNIEGSLEQAIFFDHSFAQDNIHLPRRIFFAQANIFDGSSGVHQWLAIDLVKAAKISFTTTKLNH